jgi:amino-acid N-acetyltransferase
MNVADLRGILNYVPRYRDRTFIISLDGEIATEDNLPSILTDIAVLWNLGIRIVIVHGVPNLGPEHQLDPDLCGQRPIPAAELDSYITAASRLTHEILEGLAARNIRALYPNAITAAPTGILSGTDQLTSGKVTRVDSALLNQILSQNLIPVLSPLGFDGEGHTFRLLTDSVAFEVARTLKADKLIYITAHDSLIGRDRMSEQLPVNEAERYLVEQKNKLPTPLLTKLTHAIQACRMGINRVHLVDGRVDEALLGEIFLNEGTGTMIYANDYQSIRPAQKKDIPALRNLMLRAEKKQELLPRSRQHIIANLQHYSVFEMDGHLVGCVALIPYPQAEAAEIASLCIHPSHRGQGIGRKLVAFLEDTARQKKLRRLFVVSTQAAQYFQTSADFKPVDPSELPPERLQLYHQSGRNSIVLAKNLSS